MDTHTYLRKSKVQKQLLGLVHHAQLFLSDRLAIRETGGQAGKGLLFPCRQTQLMGNGTDIVLIQFAVAQRAFDSQLFDSDQARTVIAIIVHVRAFHDSGYALRLCQLSHFGEKLLLAQVTAIFRVLGKALDGQLLGFADQMVDALLFAESLCLAKLTFRERAGYRCHSDTLVSQYIVGHL